MSGSAVVTGGAGGIGSAVCARLLATGWAVVAVDADATAAARLAAAHPAAPLASICGDVTDESVLAAAADQANQLAPLAGWVNNAAAFPQGALHEITAARAEQALRVNLLAAVLGSAVAIRRWLAAGAGGAIVNVSSLQARRALPEMSLYAAAKAGLEALTRNTAVEYGRHRIRANAVAPGTIATPGLRAGLAALSPAEAQRRERDWAAQHPLGRMGEPAEVAAAVGFLLSAEASFITGHVLAVDGGWSASG